MPSVVSRAITRYIHHESQYGGYETAEKFEQEISETYQTISSFINAQPHEIALVENATAAWNLAFASIDFQEGDRILTSASEYASNFINYLNLKRKIDISVEVIPNDNKGQSSPDALREMMDEDVRLVSITHMPTNSGLVNPVEAIGSVVQSYDCFYLLDACQSVGHYPLDVDAIGCDLLSATGRKYLRGPRGTGFLYVKEDKIEKLHPPFLDLHAATWTSPSDFEIRKDARKFENWESNYAGILGLKQAVIYAKKVGIATIWKRNIKLADQLRSELSDIAPCTVQDIGQEKSGIVTFSVDNAEPELIKQQLADKNINVSISSRASTLIDMQERNLEEVIRASVHYYNNQDDIGRLISALKSITGN